MTFRNLSFTLLMGLLLVACHEDVEDNNTSIEGPGFVPTVYNELQADVLGYVYDENGDPVADALVTLYSGTTTTDELGTFRMDDQKLDPQGTYIKVEKDGYFLGSDRLYPVKDRAYSYVQMMQLGRAGDLTSSIGGQIQVEGGGSITFESGSLGQTESTQYDGAVSIYAKRLSTQDPDLADKMPGGLYAVDKKGNNVVLGTLGMMAVEMRDEEGREINLLDGKTAKLTFPIAEPDLESAPDVVPLWSFDEVAGLWREEGEAIKEGSNYVAEVSHFSFWNCDIPYPLVPLCGKVTYGDGSPASFILVTADADNFTTASTYTDQNGEYCGKVPHGREITLRASSVNCDEEIATVVAGPYREAATAPTLVIENVETYKFAGTVVCNGNLLADALVLLRHDDREYMTLSDAQGQFSYNLASCTPDKPFAILAVADGTGETSIRTEVAIGSQDIQIEVCESACDWVLELINNPEPCTLSKGTLEAIVQGSGNYTYQWPDNSTQPTFAYSEAGLYTVVVTDDDGCVKSQTLSILPDSLLLEVTGNVTHINCEGDLGAINLRVFGGAEPYSYVWRLDNVIISSEENLSDLAAGTYVVEVMDIEGCIATAEFTIGQQDLAVGIDMFVECNQSMLIALASGGTPPYNYQWFSGEDRESIYVFESTYACVTVTDISGCQGEACVDVSVLGGPDVFIPQQFFCSTDSLYDLDLPQAYFYTLMKGDTIIAAFTPNENQHINVVRWGFEFTLMVNTTEGCEERYDVKIPNQSGLQIEHAADGSIEAVMTEVCDPMFECSNILIYDADDLTKDLSNQNGSLPAGDYVVVIRNLNSNCIIAYEHVTL